MEHALAHTFGSADYGELAKADKAALLRFERMAARMLSCVST